MLNHRYRVPFKGGVLERRGPACPRAAATPVVPTVVTDAAVPEGHKGLHGFLYGTGGAEEHDQAHGYSIRKGEDDGSTVMTVEHYLSSRDGEKPLGVYLVLDAQQQPMYVGYSRNMVLGMKTHLARVGPERCAHVRTMVFGNKAMSSRANLEREAGHWLRELGATPPGNAAERELWEGPVAGAVEGGAVAAPGQVDVAQMSAKERAAYEEKKLKMRKAMGDKSVEVAGAGAEAGVPEEEPEDSPETRRLKLMAAMNRGDWSAVIDQQTREALAGSSSAEAEAEAAAASQGASPDSPAAAPAPGAGAQPAAAIVSPFAGSATAGAPPPPPASRPAARLSVEAVERALDEVRPYLMADGGDVEVVEVSGDGVVYLRLQGACSSCPSQSATMKGGIERVIRSTFGEQVRDILQLDAKDPSASVEMVDNHLNMLRGAITNFGGSVDVVSLEDGVCTIRYVGPPAIGKGVAGAVKDTFRDIKEVRLV